MGFALLPFPQRRAPFYIIMGQFDLTPSTRIDAVNVMLRYVDEQPINAIPTDGVTPASIAAQMLHEEHRTVLSMGFEFNTEFVTLTPDTENIITIPDNYLRVSADGNHGSFGWGERFRGGSRFVQRGNKLYDKLNNTFEIETKLEVEVVLFLDFEEIPEDVRRYITIRSSRRFVRDITGEVSHDSITVQDEIDARAKMMDQQIFVGNYNITDSPDLAPAVWRTIQPWIT
jgi:hypothetical protein